MGCPSEIEIGSDLTFSVITHDPNAGTISDADTPPIYRIYEDGTTTPILTGSMSLQDGANTTGYYSETVLASAGNGFENGKTYNIYIEGTVGGDTGGITFGLKAYDHRRSNVVAIDGSTAAAQRMLTLYSADEAFYQMYDGPRGVGIYIDPLNGSAGTTLGVNGTSFNPVLSIADAQAIDDGGLACHRYYLRNGADVELIAPTLGHEFVGIGEPQLNTINLKSQDVGGSSFYNLTLEGDQGGTDRIFAVNCALQEAVGPDVTTLNIYGMHCGIVNQIQIDTSDNNVLDHPISLVAGTGSPTIIATGAAGSLSIRHASGGWRFENLSASHNVSVEGQGQVIFAASNSTAANVAIRGHYSITDETTGMNNLSIDAVVNQQRLRDAMTLNTAEVAAAGSIDEKVDNAETAAQSVLTLVDTEIAEILNILQTTGVEINGATANKISDHVWRRNLSNIAASADGDALDFRSPLGMARKLVNKFGFNGVGNALLIREEDDATTFGSQAVTTDANAVPIVDIDTA